MPDANTLERIELLRGPASMLYGRGDPGGTFNIVSKQPQAERRTVLGSQVNTDGLRRGTLDTTGALDESAAFTYRLNLVAEGSDSFRDHVESERYNIAPVLRWQLSDDTALILEGDYLHNRSEEHTSELQSLMRISYAVLCLKKKNIEPKPNIILKTYNNNIR